MPIDEEIRDQNKDASIYEMTLTRLIVEFGISSNEAASLLIRQATKTLTSAGVRAGD